MTTQHHVCVSLAHVNKMLSQDNHGSLCLQVEDDGVWRSATKSDVFSAAMEAAAKGYDVLPPCDNVDEKGHCKGHKVQS